MREFHEILKIQDFNRGATLKQGDTTTLRYYLYDADEDGMEDIIGQNVEVVFLRKGEIYYRTMGEVDDKFVCSFSIDQVLPPGVYHIEFVVAGHIFPSGDTPYFNITKSSKGADDAIIYAYGFEDFIIRAVDILNNKFVDVTKERLGLENVLNVEQASKVEFDAHVEDFGTHVADVTTALDGKVNVGDLPEVTKANIGLGNVLNVEQASKVEFDAFAQGTETRFANVIADVVRVIDVSSYESVYAAFDDASEHDIVYFPKGVFVASGITISKSISVTGEGTIKKERQNEPILMTNNVDYFDLKGVTIDGAQSGFSTNDIEISNTKRFTVDSVKFKNTGRTSLEIKSGVGTGRVSNCEFINGRQYMVGTPAQTTYHILNSFACDLTINNNIFKTDIEFIENVQSSPIAIFSTKAKNILVSDNKLINCGHIDLYSENDYATVINNFIIDCHWSPIKVQESKLVKVLGNTIIGTRNNLTAINIQPHARVGSYGSVDIDKRYGVIANNIIDSGYGGIQINGTPLSQSVIDRLPNLTQHDILAKGYQVTGNVITNTVSTAIYLLYVKDITIKDNTINNYGSRVSLDETRRSAILLDYGIGRIDIRNNTITNDVPQGTYGITNTSGRHPTDTLPTTVTVSDNVIEKSGSFGIYFLRLANMIIERNFINNVTKPKIRVLSGEKLTVRQNTGYDTSDYSNLVFANAIPEKSLDSGKRGKQEQYLTSKPVSGTYSIGDVVYRATPLPGQSIGWICTEGGTPGTWKGFGTVEV